MQTNRTLRTLLALILASSAPLLVDCGGDKAPPTTAHVQAGDMPEGATWDGVYFNPLFGNLHLVQSGTSISGKWKRTDGSAWGELNGPVVGTVFHYEWIEHKIGLVGPTSITKGKGYFVYKRPAGDNIDDQLDGEWGLANSEVGNRWDGVKQRNVKADPNSVHPAAESGGVSKDWK